ncbi:MAG: type 4a pilus biogenesis protein PilO [Candidatus Electrothrix sp. YB6]
MAKGKEKPASKFDTFIEEKYIPLDDKIKLAIAAVILIVLIVAFYFSFFSPKMKKIEELERKENDLQVEVNKAEKAAKNITKIKAELAETEEKFKKIRKVLPEEKEIPDLLSSISDRGTSAGLDFDTFKPGNETPKDFYAEIPISIQIRGPYHNVGYFLDQVSKLERIVTVDNIKMSSPKEEEGEMLLSSSCNMLTYRFTGEQAASPDKKEKKKKK